MGSSIGGHVGAPINEAVFLLSALAPARLNEIRSDHPQLEEHLREGVFAGEQDNDEVAPALIREKARIVIAALEEASTSAHAASAYASAKIASARRRRLISEVLVLVGSSTVLGAVALDGRVASVVSAVLTLLAALGNLFAEHHERVLNPQLGSIYEIFQKLSEGRYSSRRLMSELELTIRYEQDTAGLVRLIEQGNALCEELNRWLIQIVGLYTVRESKVSTTSLERGWRSPAES